MKYLDLLTYGEGLSGDEARQKAELWKIDVVFPDEHTLQIDIDSSEQMQIYRRKSEELAYLFDFTENVRPSSSGLPGHYHVTVTLGHNKCVTPIERIFLQLFLGSDPERELRSYAGYLDGDLESTLFFENRK